MSREIDTEGTGTVVGESPLQNLAEDDMQLLDELKKAKKPKEYPEGKTKIPQIRSVPKNLLQNAPFLKEKCFIPKALSIGPIHGADEHSPLFNKQLKIQLAGHFLSVSDKDEVCLFKKIQSTDFKEKIETYFNENATSFSKEKLPRLVFLDGCAILGFINIYVNKNLKMLDINDGQPALIQRDLFLLENQIPFIVLDELMSYGGCEEKSGEIKNDFVLFVCHMSNITFPRHSFLHYRLRHHIFSKKKEERPVHILDVLREVILLESYYFGTIFTALRGNFFIIFCCAPILLIGCIVKLLRKSQCCLPKYYNKSKQSFRNVQELKTAGIRFKSCDSLTDISFHSLFSLTAQLMLPRLVVNESTECRLLNLVAYEMCLHESHPHQDQWVTSYLKLLDLLIDNEQDVKDLRAAGILLNSLSSDAEAAGVINTMGSECPAPHEDAYGPVKKNIERHYVSKFARWTTEICHAHFSSPWTILALFAATTALGLTFIQTWYAVYPK